MIYLLCLVFQWKKKFYSNYFYYNFICYFQELDSMFNNILDIYDLTVTLLGSLEDMLEISAEKQVPALGTCFEELAEVSFFFFNIYIIADFYILIHSSIIQKSDLMIIFRLMNLMCMAAMRKN